VLPIADRHTEFAEQVAEQLGDRGLRVDVDSRSESVGRKIRDAELAKIPFMLVAGDAEQQASKVAVRRHGEGDLGLMDLAGVADLVGNAR
jgi:threonyl-tRNA synthetase